VFTFLPSRSVNPYLSRLTFHGLCSLALAAVLLAGCATGLKRDGECLASLTPEYLDAQDELARLEASWREALRRRDAGLNRPTAPFPASPVALTASAPLTPDESASRAYQRLRETRTRYQPMFTWYDRVYQRVQVRLDEERVLSDLRMVLLTGPGVVFYPVIRWNVRSVFWDGVDPDSESDPVTRFCADRLRSHGTPVTSTGPGRSGNDEGTVLAGNVGR
jgi:hypothetical protein